MNAQIEESELRRRALEHDRSSVLLRASRTEALPLERLGFVEMWELRR